jgi:hypothetical protein
MDDRQDDPVEIPLSRNHCRFRLEGGVFIFDCRIVQATRRGSRIGVVSGGSQGELSSALTRPSITRGLPIRIRQTITTPGSVNGDFLSTVGTLVRLGIFRLFSHRPERRFVDVPRMRRLIRNETLLASSTGRTAVLCHQHCWAGLPL